MQRLVSNHQQFLSAPASSPPRAQQTSTTFACVEKPRAPVSQIQPRGQRPGVHFPALSAAEKETSKRRAVPSGTAEVQTRVRGDHTNISLLKDGLEKLNTGTIRCEDTRDRTGCGTCQEPKYTCWSCSCKHEFLISVGRRRGGTNYREDTCERNPCGCRQSHTKCTCCTCGSWRSFQTRKEERGLQCSFTLTFVCNSNLHLTFKRAVLVHQSSNQLPRSYQLASTSSSHPSRAVKKAPNQQNPHDGTR